MPVTLNTTPLMGTVALSALIDKIADLKSKLSSEQSAALDAAVKNLQQAIDAVDALVDANTEADAAREERLSQAEADIAALKTQDNTYAEDIADLQAKDTELEAEDAQIREDFAAADTTLQGKIDAAVGRIGTLESDVAAMKQKDQEIQTSLDEIIAALNNIITAAQVNSEFDEKVNADEAEP